MVDYSKVTMLGGIPGPPLILCRNEKVRMMIQGALHEDWARKPPVMVVDDWPEEWNVGAVVITPITTIGTEKLTSFSISGDLSEEERVLLNAYINLSRTTASSRITYMELVSATGWNRRTITKLLKQLAEKNIVVRREKTGFSLDLGTWRPDAAKARALGIEIKEY